MDFIFKIVKMIVRRKTKILFAISNLTYGGIQTQALALAKEHKKRGARIYFFWTDRYEEDFVEKELLTNNFKIIDGRFIKDKFWSKYSWRLQRYMHIIKASLIIRFYGIDYLVPYHNDLSNFFGAIHPYTGAKKTIFHIRNTVIEDRPKQNWHFKKAMKNQPIIVTNSNHAKSKFKKVYGDLYDLDISTIYNGINLRKIDNSKDWKTFFEVNSFHFIVTSVANFFAEKDYLTLFKAWQLFLERTNSNSILLIAGDEGKKGSMELYRKEVKNLRIESNVKFLGRTSYNIELLNLADANVLSTLNEGLPNVVIETLGTGTPFIGTDVNGIREVIGENYPIPLFNVGDFSKLSDIIFFVYESKYDVSYIYNYSIKRSELFSTSNLVSNYDEIIEI